MQALKRFFRGQDKHYDAALQELRQGQKTSHYMWFIFPQIRGLARSRTSFYYGIINLEEAKAYLAHPILGPRLVECTQALLSHKSKTAQEILGQTDAIKLRSSMTLFAMVSPENSVFHQALAQFFQGQPDQPTIELAQGRILDMTYRKYQVGID